MSSEINTHTITRRRVFSMSRRRKAIFVGAAAIVVASPGLAAAVIDSPPQPPLEVVVFPERDFVVTEGGPAGQALNLEIVRNGVTISTASGTTDADGLLEVNHPGGVCWQGSTPNILPGDLLRVTEAGNPANGYSVRTQGLRAEPAEILANGNVQVKGVALDANGDPLPLSRMEQRIINPDFREGATPLEKRDIRATTDDNNLVRDPGVRGGFIATHRGLNATNAQKALEGQDRVLGWMQTAANGDRMGITIWEEGEVGGPGFGGCPARHDYAVTSFNKPAIKIGTDGVTAAGTAFNADSVRVTLSDGRAGTTDPSVNATLNGASGAQTFRASFSRRQVMRLADGRLRAVGRYTVGGTAISGVNKSIIKDLKAPRPATSDTRSGVYRRAQSVTLSHPGEPRSSRIFYTTNGRTPGLGSLRFVRPIRITATKTLRAVVIDQAGNRSVSKCSTRQGCWRIVIR
jgi:large repetitive protein